MSKTDIDFKVRAIGVVHSPYKRTADAPPQDGEEVSTVRLFEEFVPALKDIEGFSHLNLIYYLHLSKGWELQITTPWDVNFHGLFTTRSPRRPSPLGFSTVELVDRGTDFLKVRGLDAVEGTPVLDIKPHIPGLDARPDAVTGWLKDRGDPKKVMRK